MKTVHLELKALNQTLLKQSIKSDVESPFVEVTLWNMEFKSIGSDQKSTLMSCARVCPVINIHEGQEVVISLDTHNWVRVWS